MRCRVCGREGFDICPECQFREQNQQCWRCRMYIPRSEMQQWRGQWICPNCRMDIEREESGVEGGRGKKEEGAAGETYEKLGKCDRCGRETMILYKFNNRNLCWYCLEEESGTDYSGAGGAGGAIRVRVASRRKRRKGLLQRIKELIFGKGAVAEEEETVVSSADIVPIKKKGKAGLVPKKTGVEGASEKKEEKPAEGEEKRPEKKERAPVVHKKPPEEEKEEGKEEGKKKKKPDWGQWKED